MDEGQPVSQFAALLRGLVEWCAAEQAPVVVIGGVAASLLGRPRLTRDVDATVLLGDRDTGTFAARGLAWGFRPRTEDALTFARSSRVLLLTHDPSGLDLDLSLGVLPFEEQMTANATVRSVEGIAVPLPRPEDLVVMKAVAGRPKDRDDIEAVLEAHPSTDLARVRFWVAQFAEALEMPEMLADLERQLARRRETR